MAKNLNSIQAGTYQSNNVNTPSVVVHKGKNQFPQSFLHPSTASYGVVDVVGAAKCEPGDVYPYKFVTDLNTFTMASPMKSKVNMYSAAFKVPMKAIYPRNWEIMYPIPNKGVDVPEDTRAILDFNSFFSSQYFDYLNTDVIPKVVSDGTSVDTTYLNYVVRSIFVLESVFSDGSLFSKLNMHFCAYDFSDNSVWSEGDRLCFDDLFDLRFIPWLKAICYTNDLGEDSISPQISELIFNGPDNISYGSSFLLAPSVDKIGTDNYISFERMIELLRSGDFVFTDIERSSDVVPLFEISPWRGYFVGLRDDVNIESVLSYQLACAHFFNNPKIDSIYSSDLFRDNLEGIIRFAFSDTYPIYFNWNGVYKQYDVFSSRVLNDETLNPFYNLGDFNSFIYCSSFWLTLFGFHNSLRYGDYFTGAHPQMLAVGDIDAPVIDGSVNALDMTRKLQLTRLLNKVNISGPRMIDYLRALFGGSVPEAPDDVPIRLSREVFDVSGFEVNNTGEAQLSTDDPNITTTNLRLDDSRFMFEVSIDQPCWLVFVQYFDAHRIYSRTMDRFSFHKTRYDDFVPDLQFFGDQDVKPGELDVTKSGSSVPFAYNLRYMEYKQRYSYASGGFIRRLKSWAFVTDNNDGNPSDDHISPRYIRSSPSEFDRFYKSLTGYSLGTRFHFITFNTNVCAPYRQMVYAPEILA